MANQRSFNKCVLKTLSWFRKSLASRRTDKKRRGFAKEVKTIVKFTRSNVSINRTRKLARSDANVKRCGLDMKSSILFRHKG